MAKSARRSLIESAKADVVEAHAEMSTGHQQDTETPFSVESFFDGIDADELFDEALDVSIDRAHERTT